MTLRLNGSTSGYTEIDAPAVAGNNNLKLPGGNGSDGNILGTDGAGNLSWVNGRMVLETAKASTSGTFVDFTGIPSWVKRITVTLNGVSTSGISVPLIQLGDSGGIENTGYTGTAASIFSAANPGISAMSAGFSLAQVANWTAAGIVYGSYTLTLVTASTNTWAIQGQVGRPADTTIHVIAGTKSLSATLDRIQLIATNGTDTFDAGSINILYEG